MDHLPRYYTHMTDYTFTTHIRSVETRDNQLIITLEDTIFHPQGGGQPADMGTITSSTGVAQITHVKRREDGVIEHIGTISKGTLQPGDHVDCAINQTNRELYTRLHSAGHVIDVALEQLNIRWEPGKGYHFPDGPYVEYRTTETPDTGLSSQLEAMLAELIAQDIPTQIDVRGPKRVVTLAGKAIPCGGTHVLSLKELGSIQIRHIKYKSRTVKIGYSISP